MLRKSQNSMSLSSVELSRLIRLQTDVCTVYAFDAPVLSTSLAFPKIFTPLLTGRADRELSQVSSPPSPPTSSSSPGVERHSKRQGEVLDGTLSGSVLVEVQQELAVRDFDGRN